MWFKICGVRDVQTARQIARLRPSAIGLNFYTQTPRAVSTETAVRIVDLLPPDVEPVGLFVNHTLREVLEICQRCKIQRVQLHGDEPPEFLAELLGVRPELRIIRSCRVREAGIATVADYLESCRQLNISLSACLIDAHVPGMYGGSGKTVSWESLQQDYRREQWPPLLLAGGLTPENVATAIRTVRPWGVDVASGVESSPGQKDMERVARFLDAARQAFNL